MCVYMYRPKTSVSLNILTKIDLCVDGYSSVLFHHQEGKDKKFLITSLQAIHEKRQYPLSPSSRPQPQGSEVSDPDCAVFISVRNRKMFSNRKLKCSATENVNVEQQKWKSR